MKHFKIKILLCMTILFQVVQLSAQQKQNEISLNGEWRFSLDFDNTGLNRGWESDTYKYEGGWDKVQVPHCFSADARYLFFEGTTWYRKSFTFDDKTANKKVFLHFEGIFNRSEIWLNGKKMGSHEGGYTPFEFDVTANLIKGKNILVVKTNNQLDSLTIPTILNTPSNAGNVGWVNYGGITRDVSLLVKPETHIHNVKIETDPDLLKGNSIVKIKTFLVNTKGRDTAVIVGIKLFKDGKPVQGKFKTAKLTIGKNDRAAALTTILLDAKNTTLWSVDHPALYQAVVVLGTDTQTINFGIRKVEVKNASLLLNGEPVKYGGGNLVLDYPKFGSVVNDTIADKYLRLMKQGGMEFQRLSHYALPKAILDWADKNGMLIIAENGNWNYGDIELNNPKLRTIYKKQLQEMIEADWNHPSIIAYSVGNEFDSHHEAGISWSREMLSFVKTIDTSRLNTLVSNKLDRGNVVKPEDEASFYTDFVCLNNYSKADGLETVVNKVLRLYPDKPLLISEWGQRTDRVKSEQERVDHVKQVMAVLRKSPNVIGCSWWSFNDYRSRYANSNAEGFRPWGLVDYDFKPRDAYWAQQEEFAPVSITRTKYQDNKLTLQLLARNDFPRYTLKNYKLKYSGGTVNLPTLSPGEKKEITLSVSGQATSETIHLLKPTGFNISKTVIQLK